MMKVTLGVCLLLYIASVKGADVITSAPEKDRVVKLADVAPALLTCVVKPGETYTNFKWKQENDDLCTSADKDTDCAFTTAAAVLYEIDGTTKQNLKVKATKAVTYGHAGKYTCSIETKAESNDGDVTVVGEPDCTTTFSIPKGVATEIYCTIPFKGNTKPTLKIGDAATEVKSDIVDELTKVTTRTAKRQITQTEATKNHACKYDTQATGWTPCNIVVKTYDMVIKTAPKSLYFAKIDATGYHMPCTADATKTYAQVAWYKAVTKVCTGKKAGTSDACTPSADYKIDDPAKHDLKITKITDTSVGAYECNVELTAGTEGLEKHPTTLAVIKKASPVCDGKWDGTKLNLNCSVEFKGTDTAPTIQWTIKDNKDVIKGATTTPEASTDWKSVDHTATAADASTKIYVCHVKKDGVTDLATCEQGGASALSAKFFQSTLLALVVVFVLNRFQ